MADKKKPVWTNDQKTAISDSSDNILVSAGAGSGKTAVLTERIIQKLTDKDSPLDISRMIIVTYTQAAAGELKERIGKAISDAMAADPSNKNLRKQYLLLSKAHISTIHSFCLDIIKSNFQKLGLSPDIRTLDGSQASLMKRQIADTVITNYYDKLEGYNDIEDFVSFADNFITINDNNLVEILTSAYEKVASLRGGINFILDSAKEYKKAAENGFDSSIWADVLFDDLSEKLIFYKKLLSPFGDIFTDGDEKVQKKFIPAHQSYLDMLEKLTYACNERSYEKIKAVFDTNILTSIGRHTITDYDKRIDDYRVFAKEYIDFIKKEKIYFSKSTTLLKQEAEKSASILSDLYKFLLAFEKRYTYEKRLRGLIDFTDMEKYAHQLLIAPDGSPSDVAATLSADFDEIYIDEYQDVNPIQDEIFAVFGEKCKRFMVGDIKQSIYGFRGSEPQIFADYRSSDDIKRINLNANFRCDPPIIDFANEVCGKLFRYAGKTFEYDSGDDLAAEKSDKKYAPVEISVMAYPKMGRKKPKPFNEAEYIASKISEMINDGYKPRDFCILLRKKNHFGAYINALEKYSIPCIGEKKRTLFQNPEVLLMLSLLNVIDNPTRDIHLAAVLKSPLYNFSFDELVEIRKSHEKGSLFQALASYTQEKSFEKGLFFLNKLTEYRKLSNEPVDAVIRKVMDDSGILTFVTSNENTASAKEKKRNLTAFYEMSRKFENGTFKGLYQFLRYVDNQMGESSEEIEPPHVTAENNAVTVTTIHKSKGLEYPVIILANAADSLSAAHNNGQILYDRHIGTALKLSDRSGLVSFNTLYRDIQSLSAKKRDLDEELRILYVALTRPKEKLIITANIKTADVFMNNCRIFGKYIDNETGLIYSFSPNYLSWIMTGMNGKIAPTLYECDPDGKLLSFDSLINNDNKDKNINIDSNPCDTEAIDDLVKEYKRRFEFEYPSKDASSLPAKLAVSDLYPSILDDHDDAVIYSNTRIRDIKTPKFITGEEISSAAKGTATHQFMQFCNFALLKKTGVEKEIERLTENGFIDSHTASLINRNAVDALIETELFDQLLCTDFIKRELRFNITLPACEFTQNLEKRLALSNEKILVQGIMDCVFRDKNGDLCILDYKTDTIPKSISDTSEAEKFLTDRHSRQLSYYFAACEKMMCEKPKHVILYSFSLGKSIEIPKESMSLIYDFTEA